MIKKFAVIGHPIGHTMSPFIHNKLFALSGIEVEYLSLDIAPETLAEDLNDSMKHLCGFNVTIPHKEAIIPLLDSTDDSANKYNAVNCVKRENGKLYGCSTDAYGFTQALKANGVALEGNVLILGAGGAAKTLAREATDNGCTVTVAVRDQGSEKSRALQKWFADNGSKTSITTFDKIEGEFELCVNATPVGMYPNTDVSVVGVDVLSRCSAVFDAVYNPRETELIKLAKGLGLKTVGGMAMLVWQAVKAHEFWYGGTFDVAEVEKIIDAANEEMERIFYAK